jgi:two-component system CheB/CheR fusion protein
MPKKIQRKIQQNKRSIAKKAVANGSSSKSPKPKSPKPKNLSSKSRKPGSPNPKNSGGKISVTKKEVAKQTAVKKPLKEKSAAAGPEAGAATNDCQPLVAIGASAGGLEAIIGFLDHLGADTGAAYVIIQHLSPTHESILPELLERKTQMPVHKVENGMHVDINNVYVIPPGKYLSIVDSKLTLSPRERVNNAVHPIDHFLSALAPSYQGKAVAVILSGTANDGTAGIKDIKAAGGITFAQDDTAKFQGMPRNAIDSGYIDFVLPPERIATELRAIIPGMYKNETRIEQIEANETELRKIRMILLKKHHVDFTLYKQTTIIRRIIRRIALNRLNSVEQYTRYLIENPREVDLLYKDLLINVTSFFREPTMYNALSRKIFPRLLKGRRENDPIRIWVPACATGEEPYSIAISLFEYLKDRAISTPIQIFATDLSEGAIVKARSGIYGKNAPVNVSAQRLKNFFTRVEGNYQIIKPIRDICIFATHNLLKDPPFSRMDIISCQNVLIYMEPNTQKKILQAFHYALNPGKYLVLGKSETTGSSMELFDQLDKELRIYSKKSIPANMQLDFSIRSQPIQPIENIRDEKSTAPPQPNESDIEKEAARLLFLHYMPASILVNKDLQILRFYGVTFPYLQPASGKASLHLLKMIRDELIFELRTLIRQTKKEGRAARKEDMQFMDRDEWRTISLEVLPVNAPSADACLLIVFQPAGPAAPAKPFVKKAPGQGEDEKDRRIVSFDRELKEAREHVKSITEDFEAAREELQSANEEVLSSNEELQSINEELETSKEELQSTNEELITINEEMQIRNTDLRESVDFTKAIVETIRESLIVLDPDLRILAANNSFYTVFRLGQEEVDGHFFYEAGNGQFDIADLRAQLKDTTGRGNGTAEFTIKHDFPGLGGRVLQCKAMRMAGESGKRARMLLAMEDVTGRSVAEKALLISEERFRHVSESGFINILFFHTDGRIVDANHSFLELLGYSQKDLQAGLIRWDKATPPEWKEETARQMNKFQKTGKLGPYEQEYIRKNGRRFRALVVGARLENDLGIQFVIDISGKGEG